jgi:hypothetical protein
VRLARSPLKEAMDYSDATCVNGNEISVIFQPTIRTLRNAVQPAGEEFELDMLVVGTIDLQSR